MQIKLMLLLLLLLLQYPGLLWEYWQKNMRRKARKIYILLCLERTWERGSHLENSIYGNSNNNNNNNNNNNKNKM